MTRTERADQKAYRSAAKQTESFLVESHRIVSEVIDAFYETFCERLEEDGKGSVSREVWLSLQSTGIAIRAAIVSSDRGRDAIVAQCFGPAFKTASCGVDAGLVDELVETYGTGVKLVNACIALSKLFDFDRQLRDAQIVGSDKPTTEIQRVMVDALRSKGSVTLAKLEYIRYALGETVEADDIDGIEKRLKDHVLKARMWAKTESGREVTHYTPMRVDYLLHG